MRPDNILMMGIERRIERRNEKNETKKLDTGQLRMNLKKILIERFLSLFPKKIINNAFNQFHTALHSSFV